MKIEKINSSIYLKSTENPAENNELSMRMFNADFNKDEGLRVEKNENNQEYEKTYTKTTRDENGNEVILIYRSKDGALLQKETKYSYGYSFTEFIKPGTNIIQRAVEKNTDGNIIAEEVYYENSPFGLKEIKEFEPKTGKITQIASYENGSEKALSKTIYDNDYTTVMTLAYGEPEETTVYRKDGSIEQQIIPQIINGEKRYLSSIYREDGTLYSEGTYADAYATFPIEETEYSYDGTTVDSKEYTAENSKVYRERFDANGSLRVREIYDQTGRKLQDRLIYDKEGKKYIHTQYNSGGEIIHYDKNTQSVANTPFQEKLLNGKIDTSFKQGLAGTCYIASTIKSLLSTEKGKEILANSIKYDDKNDISTITFNGVQKEYSFTKEEIEKAMGRLGTGDPDFTAFLLGYEKYRAEELHKAVDGGLGTEVIEALTGNQCETNIIFGMQTYSITNETLDKLQKDMETKEMVITAGTPPKEVRTEFSEKDYKLGFINSHAYAIKQITDDSIVLIEPGKDKEIKISRETFLKKFISYSAADLNQNQ